MGDRWGLSGRGAGCKAKRRSLHVRDIPPVGSSIGWIDFPSFVSPKCPQRSGNSQGKRRHINLNKCAGLSRTGWVPKSCLCVCVCVCVFLVRGPSLWGRKHINKIPGQSRELFVYVFVFSMMCKWTRPFWGTDCRRAPKSLSSAHFAGPDWESSKVLAGLALFEMLSQYPQSAFQGLCGGHQRGQQQFATQTLRPFAQYRFSWFVFSLPKITIEAFEMRSSNSSVGLTALNSHAGSQAHLQLQKFSVRGVFSYPLSGPYRTMRAAMRCERRYVLNTEMAGSDAMQKSWWCAFSLRKSSAMRSHDVKTLAMRCRDAGHSGWLTPTVIFVANAIATAMKEETTKGSAKFDDEKLVSSWNLATPAAPYRSLQRVSWGLPAPGSKKCPKQSRNSLWSLETVYFELRWAKSRDPNRESLAI